MNKKHIFHKLLCPFLALLLTLGSAVPAFADTPASWPSAPEIADETGVLMEASTGQVLFDKGMNEIRYPASTTKVMTALLIVENIPDLNEKITFTDVILPDLEPGNSTINAQVGEELTVEQCLYAIMLASANEVCTQMAVRVAGSVADFTKMMNERAKELGCKNTNFVNANGLPDPNHYSTAYDLALILAEAVKNEGFCKVAGSALYTIPPTNKTAAARNLENSNLLLRDGEYHYEGAVAGKTGHTEAAKNTLVTAAKRDDMTLICVVMRSEGTERFTDTITLFDYGFDNFYKTPVYWLSKEEPAGYAVLPNGVKAGSLMVSDEDSDGKRTRTYSYQGKEVLSVSVSLPIQMDTDSSDGTDTNGSIHKISSLFSRIFPAVIIFFAVICVILGGVIVKTVLDKNRKKKRKKIKDK